jgi:Methyltransferase domain
MITELKVRIACLVGYSLWLALSTQSSPPWTCTAFHSSLPNVGQHDDVRKRRARVALLFVYPCIESVASPACTRRLSLHNATRELQVLVQQQSNESVEIEGYILAKRGFGPSFCFLDISDAHHHQFDSCASNNGDQAPVQVILKRQDFASERYFDGYMRAAVPGALVLLTGVAAPTRNPGEALLLVHSIQILGLPRNPQHVRVLLQAVHDGALPLVEVSVAANMTTGQLQQGLDRYNAKTRNRPEVRRQPLMGLAKEVLQGLRQPDNYPTEMLAQKSVRGVYTLPKADRELQNPPTPLRELLQHRDDAANVLRVSDILASDGHPILGTAADATGTVVVIEGSVQNRRRYSGNITVVELVDKVERSTTIGFQQERLKCVLHPSNGLECSDMYGQLLAPGSRARLTGYCSWRPSNKVISANSTTDKSELVFWIRKVRIVRSSWRPLTVQYLLEQFVAGKLDAEEAGDALGQSDTEIDNIRLLGDLTQRQWRAAEISAELQSVESRMAAIGSESLQLLESFDEIRRRFPVEHIESTPDPEQDSSRSGSRWERKKAPQLDWMTEQVREIIQSHPDYQKRPLKILDVGGGKGYLANCLAGALGCAVQIEVIDVAHGAANNGAMRSRRLQLPVKYTVGDASEFNLSEKFDMVVALHACGALTDVALGHALSSHASFVICPCCFRSNPLLRVTAGLNRRGNKNKLLAEDFLGVRTETYDTLKLLAEIQGDSNLANRAIHSICALRASAVHAHLLKEEIDVRVCIRTFPIAFSSRNFCLVGTTLKRT